MEMEILSLKRANCLLRDKQTTVSTSFEIAIMLFSFSHTIKVRVAMFPCHIDDSEYLGFDKGRKTMKMTVRKCVKSLSLEHRI